MAVAKIQIYENMAVNRCECRLGCDRKKDVKMKVYP
jgi:hypothetical protein